MNLILKLLMVMLLFLELLLGLSMTVVVVGFTPPSSSSSFISRRQQQKQRTNDDGRIFLISNKSGQQQQQQQQSVCRRSVPILWSSSSIRSSSSSSSSTTNYHRDESNSSSNEMMYTFDEMKKVIQRLDNLESLAPDILRGFYEPHLKSFSVKPGSSNDLSVTSTCYSLLAIHQSSTNNNVYDSIISQQQQNYQRSTDTDDADDDDDENNNDMNKELICIPSIIQALLESKWREDDLFQVPLLLYTILTLDENRETILRNTVKNEATASKIRQLITAVLKARPKRRSGDRQTYSDYITYQICRVLSILQQQQQQSTSMQRPSTIPDDDDDDDDEKMASSEGDFISDFDDSTTTSTSRTLGVGGLPMNAIPDGAAAEVSLGLARSAEIASNELCRQLAYRAAGDSTSFDVMRLAYSLLTYVESTQSLIGVAGRELIPGQGVSPGTQVTPMNQRLVRAALNTFFNEQHPNDGLWDKGQPIYQSFRRQGRNVGNAFVFAVDTVGSLLRSLPAEYFRPHLKSLERTLDWIEGHQTVEVIADYCDPESGECYGKALRGWSSPHLRPDSGPQAWSTAQVLTCVSLLKTTIQQLMHKDVLKEFNGIAYSEKGIRPESWDRLLDTDLGSAVQNRTIKSVLEERVVTPFESSIYNPSYGAAYSAILHGPPGTAKTTICEALAQKMGYDFLVIDTTAFLADGLTNVANRIRYVFSRLMALQECVILFDEIEEFALNRETPGLSMESRMLTTSMLTAINDLRRAKQSVFFVATNRLRAFDSAITRPGRFDMQLFVGTPNLDARVIQFKNQLSSLSLTKSQKANVVESYYTFLESVWEQDAMFMNYLEGMQFASACASLVKNSPTSELDIDLMSAIFTQQAAVMTVRGAVREEYLASMKLSRT